MNSTIFRRTKAGRKYHRADCSVIDRVQTSIPLAQAEKLGLTSCNLCDPNESTVYKTFYGKKYHKANCDSFNITYPIKMAVVRTKKLAPCTICNP